MSGAVTNKSDNAASKRGGARVGAGRKKNSGAFKEGTEPIRIPSSLASEIKLILNEVKKRKNGADIGKLHDLIRSKSTGIMMPMDNGEVIDVADLIVDAKHAMNCFALIINEDQLDHGLKIGDCVIFNKTRKPKKGDLVASLDGCLLKARVYLRDGDVKSANANELNNILGVAVSMTRGL